MSEFELTTDGENVVGPVSLDQVRRGLAAQKVPPTAQIRRVGEEAWHPVLASLTWEPSKPSVVLHADASVPQEHVAPSGTAPPAAPASTFEASSHRWVVLAVVGVLAVLGLVVAFIAGGSKSKTIKPGTSTSSTAEPALTPEAAATEGFKLWDKDPRSPSDELTAVRLWQDACDAGNASACAGMGAVYLWGNGKPKDMKKGVELLRPACDKGVMRGCVWLGQAYFNAWGLPEDLVETKRLWSKACDANEPRACHLLGYTSWDKEGPLVWRNIEGGLALLKKACALGYKKSCALVRLDGLRAKVHKSYWSSTTDGSCTGKGLPPYRWTYEGGTFEEDKEVAGADGCSPLFIEHNTTFCCPQRPVTF